jgi:hypothetical protein
MTDATPAEAFAAFMAARLAPNGTPPPEQSEQQPAGGRPIMRPDPSRGGSGRVPPIADPRQAFALFLEQHLR